MIVDKAEIVYDNGNMHYEMLSQYNGVGSNKAVDMRGNIYAFDHLLNRWEKKNKRCYLQ